MTVPCVMERDIGKQEAQIANARDDIALLKKELAELKSDISDIKSILSEARGGWKALAIVGGISGTIGAIAAKFVSWAGTAN